MTTVSTITTITTEEQQEVAKKAAWQRYQYNLWTPNRPGWTGGKCPETEYRGILGEIGAANLLGYDWTQLTLFSEDPADFTKPDIGDWEVKTGSKFSKKDIIKGAKFIIWITPYQAEQFYCGIDTCKEKIHPRLTGVVEARGWTDLDEDLHLCHQPKGTYYVPTGDAMRWPHMLPKFGVAA